MTNNNLQTITPVPYTASLDYLESLDTITRFTENLIAKVFQSEAQSYINCRYDLDEFELQGNLKKLSGYALTILAPNLKDILLEQYLLVVANTNGNHNNFLQQLKSNEQKELSFLDIENFICNSPSSFVIKSDLSGNEKIGFVFDEDTQD